MRRANPRKPSPGSPEAHHPLPKVWARVKKGLSLLTLSPARDERRGERVAEERGRVRAWARRTLWMGRAVAADFGLGAGRVPVWRRDNPFWDRAIRADTRRSLLAGRLLLTTVALAVLLVGGLVLHTHSPRIVQGILHSLGSPLNWQGWLFVTVSFVHVLLIFGTRQAFSPLFSREAQRQTLPLLLLSPLRRAEMAWAMAVAPAAAAVGRPVRPAGVCSPARVRRLRVAGHRLAVRPFPSPVV